MRLLSIWLLLLTMTSVSCAPTRSSGDDDDTVADDDDTADDDDSFDDDDTTDNDDDDAVVVDVIITDASPLPDDTDFVPTAELWVRFDRAPNSATLTLQDANAAVVASTSVVDGTIMSLQPSPALVPSSSYSMVVDWTPCNGCPTTINFSTGAYGTPMADPAGVLVNATYSVDLGTANFIEPPGVGPILQSQLGDTRMLLMALPESDFSASAQPGMHVLGASGALVDPVNNVVVQAPCMPTFPLTAGPDELIGTADDEPALWTNPAVQVGPVSATIPSAGMAIPFIDLVIAGTFGPSGDDLQAGTLEGLIDTRPIAPELDPTGGPDAVCNLVEETLGVECVACLPDGTEPFCLPLVVENISSVRVEGLELQPLSCADIIELSVVSPGSCADEASAWDADGDGEYEECPSYVP